MAEGGDADSCHLLFSSCSSNSAIRCFNGAIIDFLGSVARVFMCCEQFQLNDIASIRKTRSAQIRGAVPARPSRREWNTDSPPWASRVLFEPWKDCKLN